MSRITLAIGLAILACVHCAAAAQEAVLDDAALRAIAADVMKGVGETAEAEGTAGGEDAVELDMRRCVEMTLCQNPQVIVAEADVEAARAKIGQAKSGLYPQLKVDTAFVHLEPNEPSIGGLASTMSVLSGPIQVAGAFLSPSGPNVATVGYALFESLLTPGMPSIPTDMRRDHFGATQVLYAGGQIRAAMRASKFLAESEEWRRQATLDGLEFQAKKAYTDVLLARAMARVTRESVITFERHLTDAEQMLEVGIISNFEVLRAKTERGARQSEAATAANAQRLALVNLRRVIGLPQDTPVRLTGTLDWQPVPGTAPDLVALALDHRPEVLALRKGIEAAGQNVKRVKGQYRPRVAATADFHNTDRGGTTALDGWTLAVGAELDLYQGGLRKHAKAEAKARLKGLEHQLLDVEQLVELDVRNACIQIEDAMAKIRREKGTVELGREGLRLAEVRFQEGVGTQAETLDAELALTHAETQLVLALHTYTVAHAALERAVGKSWMCDGEAAAE